MITLIVNQVKPDVHSFFPGQGKGAGAGLAERCRYGPMGSCSVDGFEGFLRFASRGEDADRFAVVVPASDENPLDFANVADVGEGIG